MLMYKSTLRFFAVLTSRRLLLRSALQDSSSLNQTVGWVERSDTHQR